MKMSDVMRSAHSSPARHGVGAPEALLRASPGDAWRLFDAVSPAVVVIDARGSVQYLNAAAERLSGRPAAEAIGQPVIELSLPDPQGPTAVAFRQALLEGHSFEGEVELRRGDGAEAWARVSAVPLYEDGEFVGTLALAWDLTVRRRLERDLSRAMTEAQRATTQQSELLARVSHELRTPLTAVMGYAELMACGIGGQVPEQHQLYLDRIRTSADYLRQIIDQLLDLSRMMDGTAALRVELVPVGHFVRETAALVEPQAMARGIDLRVVVDDSADVVIQTDSGKLRQVLLNLLTNAVKFTAVGSIELAARREGGAVLFVVKDTGVGFAPEQATAIFEPFRRLEQVRGVPGSGLGLPIVERLTRLLGGEITVASRLGVGSTFCVRLPGIIRSD